jgi:hypothetical protein
MCERQEVVDPLESPSYPATVAPELVNFEIGDISVAPKLSEIWCPNSRRIASGSAD